MSQMAIQSCAIIMCQTRLVSLEKAVLDIKSFRDLAEHSSEALSGPFKRTKVTNSDIGVSPDTARVLNGPEAIAVHAMKGVPGRTSDRSSARRQ